MFPRQWKYFIRAWVRMSLTISHHIKYITKSWMWVVKLYTVEVENCLFMWVKIINYLNYTPQHYTPQHYTPQHYTPQHYTHHNIIKLSIIHHNIIKLSIIHHNIIKLSTTVGVTIQNYKRKIEETFFRKYTPTLQFSGQKILINIGNVLL